MHALSFLLTIPLPVHCQNCGTSTLQSAATVTSLVVAVLAAIVAGLAYQETRKHRKATEDQLKIARDDQLTAETERAKRPELDIEFGVERDGKRFVSKASQSALEGYQPCFLICEVNNVGDGTLEDATVSISLPALLQVRRLHQGEIRQEPAQRVVHESTTDWVGFPGGAGDMFYDADIYDFPVERLVPGAPPVQIRFVARINEYRMDRIPVVIDVDAANYHSPSKRVILDVMLRPLTADPSPDRAAPTAQPPTDE
jgi:hypothetical protein